MDERETGRICPVCGGSIVRRSYIPYIPAISRDIIGPGSRNIATEASRQTDGYHCDNCGIEFHKLPEEGK